MDFTRLRALSSLFSMLDQGIRNIQQYNQSHFDFPMQVGADDVRLKSNNVIIVACAGERAGKVHTKISFVLPPLVVQRGWKVENQRGVRQLYSPID